MHVLKKDFSASEVRIMISILNLEFNDKLISPGTIAKRLKIFDSSPSFIKVLKQLEVEKVIVCKKIIGKTKLLQVNKKMLRDYIDEQEITNYWYDYFSSHHICSWRPGFS